MMMDMMDMQKKTMKGMNPADRKEMMMEIDRMRDRMGKMMSDMRDMMMKGMMGPAPVEPGKEESGKEEPKKDAPAKEEAPQSDPHKH